MKELWAARALPARTSSGVLPHCSYPARRRGREPEGGGSSLSRDPGLSPVASACMHGLLTLPSVAGRRTVEDQSGRRLWSHPSRGRCIQVPCFAFVGPHGLARACHQMHSRCESPRRPPSDARVSRVDAGWTAGPAQPVTRSRSAMPLIPKNHAGHSTNKAQRWRHCISRAA